MRHLLGLALFVSLLGWADGIGARPATQARPEQLLARAAEARAGGDEAAEQRLLLAAIAGLDKQERAPESLLIPALERAEALYHAGRPNADGQVVQKAMALKKRLLALHRARDGPVSQQVGDDCYAMAYYTRIVEGPAGALPFMHCYLDAVTARLGPSSGAAFEALSLYASELVLADRLPEAEEAHQRALKGLEATFGRTDAKTAWGLSRYADMLHQLGRYEEYEDVVYKQLAIFRVSDGLTSEPYLFALGGLTNFYQEWGRFDEADALVWKAYLSLRTAAPNGFLTAIYAWRAGDAALRAKQPDEARELFKLSLSLHQLHMGPRYFHLGSLRFALADAAEAAQDFDEAVIQRVQGLTFLREIGREESVQAIQAYVGLARIAKRRGSLNEAVDFLIRAVGLGREQGHAGGLEIWPAYHLATIYLELGRPDQARQYLKGAIAAIKRRAALGNQLRIDPSRSQRSFRQVLALYLKIEAGAGQDQTLAWEATQLANVSDTAATVLRMAARAAAGNKDLAELVRKQQDAMRRLRDLDKLAQEASAESYRLVDAERRAQQALLSALKERLSLAFPRYQSLLGAQPVALQEIQSLLRPREALLVFSFADDGAWLWVVRQRGQPRFIPLQSSARSVADKVARLRRTLSIEDGKLAHFDTDLAGALYQELLGPAADAIDGIDSIAVVPDGALGALPLNVLIQSRAPRGVSGNRYARLNWLGRNYAISAFPSVATFSALRRYPQPLPAAWQRPFAGVGDPVIAQRADAGRLTGNAQARAERQASPGRTDKLARLPETSDELLQIARALGGSRQDVWLGPEATEARLRAQELARYRVIAFATHGLAGTNARGAGEPALVLTPGAGGGEQSDGLLAASEIAALRLTAEWVILSACNTAGSDGSEEGEVLSGLAKAFFHAGARAVLVSHWYVDSAATRTLMTRTLRHYADHPGAGKAGALSRAMASMIDDPRTGHPALWGAFTLVGDGG